MRGMHATESQSMRSEYFMCKTIGLLHCQQRSTQYLRTSQTRVKLKLTLSLNKVYNYTLYFYSYSKILISLLECKNESSL